MKRKSTKWLYVYHGLDILDGRDIPDILDILNILGSVGVWSALLVGGVVSAASHTPARISSQLVDLGEVHKIYLAKSLVSIVQLPYPITEVKVGNPNDIQALVSKTLPSELTLILRQANARSTNLIARCGTHTFVFDLIPSTQTHQDLVRISGSYGSPEVSGMGAVLIDSSDRVGKQSNEQEESQEMTLIDSSAGVHK